MARRPGLTTVDKYLCSLLAATLAKALFAFVMFYVMLDLLGHRLSAIIDHEVPWTTVAVYYASQVPQVAVRVAPFSMLASGLLVFGRCAQRNEISAMLTSGVSLRRLVAAPIALALLFSVCLFVVAESIGPLAVEKAERIEENYFRANAQEENRTGMSWVNLQDNWTCHIAKFNSIALTGESVFIRSFREDAIEHIEADRIYWDENLGDKGQWVIEDGYWFVFEPDFSEMRKEIRITQRPAPIKESPDELFAMYKSPDTKNFITMASEIRRAEMRGAPVARLWVAFHAKFAEPMVCFVMIWIAIPFALRLGRGGMAISFGASIAIAVSFLIVFGSSMGMGQIGKLDPFVAAWSANILFFLLGATLLARTRT